VDETGHDTWRAHALDDLIARLRDRAADPARRADVIADAFSASVGSMDLGGLLGAMGGAAASLTRAVAEIRSNGRTGSDTRAAAERVGALMGRPARPELLAPATEAELAVAEAALGQPLPVAIRRSYAEIANGGFGPGAGILTIQEAAARYRELRGTTPGPRGTEWPLGLLPIVDRDPGWDCVDLETGTVIAWDPEGLRERSSAAVWKRTFQELAPSTEAWLDAWVAAPTEAERTADLMAAAQVREARAARARIAAMTHEERAALGLPEVGWERVVWGGIGLDEDEG
jgi:SMI1/KNR4 family protein SUKH-1